MKTCVIVVYVPVAAADTVRAALARAGAGAIGEYEACSFSSRGTGRFTPRAGAHPAIGEVETPTAVEEERIEVICPQAIAAVVLDEMIAAHPYEEPAYHCIPVMTRDDF